MASGSREVARAAVARFPSPASVGRSTRPGTARPTPSPASRASARPRSIRGGSRPLPSRSRPAPAWARRPARGSASRVRPPP